VWRRYSGGGTPRRAALLSSLSAAAAALAAAAAPRPAAAAGKQPIDWLFAETLGGVSAAGASLKESLADLDAGASTGKGDEGGEAQGEEGTDGATLNPEPGTPQS
jgi:hypothetical protein